jgi:hypothetical protein
MNGPDYFEETRLMIHHYVRIARAIAIINCCLLDFVAIVATGGSIGNGKGDNNGKGDRPPSAYEQLGVIDSGVTRMAVKSHGVSAHHKIPDPVIV